MVTICYYDMCFDSLKNYKPGIPVSTFMYFTYTSFIISPSASITNSYSSRKYWSDSLIPRLPWGLERPGTKKFPLIRITEVALTRVSLGACWNMISMISLCKLVVRPGPDQLRLLAQCWKHKLFAKSVLSINGPLVSRVVVEIAYPRKISRFERDYHQRSGFSSNFRLAPLMPFSRKYSLIFRGEMWWFNDAWGSNHYWSQVETSP